MNRMGLIHAPHQPGRLVCFVCLLGFCLSALAPGLSAQAQDPPFVGPVMPPPGGCDIAQSGRMAGYGGATMTFANLDFDQFDTLYWGPARASAAGFAFDGVINAPNETLTFDLAGSDLANGMALWTGWAAIYHFDIGNARWIWQNLSTRLTYTVTNSEGPVPLSIFGSLGNIPVASVTGDFQVHLLLEANYGGWQPAITVFDSLHTNTHTPIQSGDHRATDSFEDGFFYTDVRIAGLQATNDGPTALGETTTLSAAVAAGTNITYTWAFGDGGIGSGATATHTYAGVGSYTATVTASNSIGEVAATTQITIEEAVVGLSAINDGPTAFGNNTILSATIAAGRNVAYAWAFGDGESGSGAVTTHMYPSPGLYTAIVTASNSVSLLTATTSVAIEDTISGLAIIHDSPTALGTCTTLTATITSGGNATYLWAFGDGETSSGAVVTHIYPDLGIYTVVVTASNTFNTVTATGVVTITEAPIVGLHATNDGPAELGQATTLTATVASGSNIAYTWAFGDGEGGSGAVVTHTYPAVDIYTATVTGANSLGSVVATTVVTITELAGSERELYLPIVLRAYR